MTVSTGMVGKLPCRLYMLGDGCVEKVKGFRPEGKPERPGCVGPTRASCGFPRTRRKYGRCQVRSAGHGNSGRLPRAILSCPGKKGSKEATPSDPTRRATTMAWFTGVLYKSLCPNRLSDPNKSETEHGEYGLPRHLKALARNLHVLTHHYERKNRTLASPSGRGAAVGGGEGIHSLVPSQSASLTALP